MDAETFIDLTCPGAEFREVNLAGARMRGVLLFDADIDGAINGLRVNGVEVAPLIEAELDRLHPERTRLRPTTVAQALDALDVVESLWAETIAGARAMPAGAAERSVDGEWSLSETLRHLIFVTDAWFGHAVLGEAHPFHPIGLPASFMTDVAGFGVDVTAKPTFAGRPRGARRPPRPAACVPRDRHPGRPRPGARAQPGARLPAAAGARRRRLPAGAVQRGVGAPPVRRA